MPHVARYFSQRALNNCDEPDLKAPKVDYSALCKKRKSEEFIPLETKSEKKRSSWVPQTRVQGSGKSQREKPRADEGYLNGFDNEAEPVPSGNIPIEVHNSTKESTFEYSSLCKKRKSDEFIPLEAPSEGCSSSQYLETRRYGSKKGGYEKPRGGDFINLCDDEAIPESSGSFSDYSRRESKRDCSTSCRKRDTDELILLDSPPEVFSSSEFSLSRHYGSNKGEFDKPKGRDFLNGLDNEARLESSGNPSSDYSRRESKRDCSTSSRKRDTEEFIWLDSPPEAFRSQEFSLTRHHTSDKGEFDKPKGRDFLNNLDNEARPESSGNPSSDYSRRESECDYSALNYKGTGPTSSYKGSGPPGSYQGSSGPRGSYHGSSGPRGSYHGSSGPRGSKVEFDKPKGRDFLNGCDNEARPESSGDPSSDYSRRESERDYSALHRKRNTEAFIPLETHSENRSASRINSFDNKVKFGSHRNESSEAPLSRREESNKSQLTSELPKTDKWKNNNSETFSETSTAFIGPLYKPPPPAVPPGKAESKTKSEDGINYELQQFYKELNELESVTEDHDVSPTTANSPQHPSSFQGSAPPSSFQGSAPPSSFQGSAPPSSYQGSAPPSSYQGSAPPSSYQGSAPPSSFQGSAPPSSFQGSAPPSSYQGSAPPSSYQGNAPPSSYQGNISPSSYQGSVPPSSYQGSVPPSSYQGSGPPSFYKGSGPPSSYHGTGPPGAFQGTGPPGAFQGTGPPGAFQGTGPPGAFQGTGPPGAFQGTGPPGAFQGTGPPGAFQGTGPPGAFQGTGPPGAFQGTGPPGAFKDSGPPSSYQGSGPPSSYQGSGPPSSYQGSGPPSSYQGSGPPSSYQGSGPPSSYQGSGPPSSYQGSGPPSSYQGSGPPSSYQGSGPPSSYQGSGPLSSYQGSGPPSSYQGNVSSSSYQGISPSSSYQGSGPPSSYQGSGPPSSYQGSGPPSSYQDSGPPSSYQGSGPPGAFQGSGPPGAFQGSGPPGAFQGSGPPGAFQGSGPPGSYQGSGPPSSYQGSVPPGSYQGSGPPGSYQGSGPTRTFQFPEAPCSPARYPRYPLPPVNYQGIGNRPELSDFQGPPSQNVLPAGPPPQRCNHPFPKDDDLRNLPYRELEKYPSLNDNHPRPATQTPWHNSHVLPEDRLSPQSRCYSEPSPTSPDGSPQETYQRGDFWEKQERHFSEIRLPQGGNVPHEKYHPRFRDEDTCTELSKKLVLLRGVPGSGKSTLARTLLEQSPNGIIFSTDDYFCQENGYEYDVKLLGDAHTWNQNRARRAMDDGRSPIIIDNTNIQSWEMKPYVQMAIERGYGVDFLEPNTWWKLDPHELEKRNTHSVPRDKITQMLERFEHGMNVSVVMNSVEPRRVRSRRPPPEAHQRWGDSEDCMSFRIR